MTTEATAWAANQRAGSPAAKLVLLLMADSIDADGCFTGRLDRVAQRAELIGPQLDDVMVTLVRAGLVRRQDDGWRLLISG